MLRPRTSTEEESVRLLRYLCARTNFSPPPHTPNSFLLALTLRTCFFWPALTWSTSAPVHGMGQTSQKRRRRTVLRTVLILGSKNSSLQSGERARSEEPFLWLPRSHPMGSTCGHGQREFEAEWPRAPLPARAARFWNRGCTRQLHGCSPWQISGGLGDTCALE